MKLVTSLIVHYAHDCVGATAASWQREIQTSVAIPVGFQNHLLQVVPVIVKLYFKSISGKRTKRCCLRQPFIHFLKIK